MGVSLGIGLHAQWFLDWVNDRFEQGCWHLLTPGQGDEDWPRLKVDDLATLVVKITVDPNTRLPRLRKSVIAFLLFAAGETSCACE